MTLKTQTIVVSYPGGVYPIYIGQNLLQESELLTKHIHGQQILIVTNDLLANLYLPQLQKKIKPSFQCSEFIMPDGEQFKTLDTFKHILDRMLEQNFHRDATIIAFGGGVVGDVAGFAAACFHRGIAFIQIPTTLLAQVDASIGGKTAVNHPRGKNLIGAFHQPQAVIIDLQFLSTLPDREYRSGIAEIIKHAIIFDDKFFEWLEQNLSQLLQRDPSTLIHAIAQSCEIKKNIVIQDTKEENVRALLNFGHTFGHAIEKILGYGVWLHGEAVAMGMVIAADISRHMNWLDDTQFHKIEKIIKNANLFQQLPSTIHIQTMFSAIGTDKKIKGNHLYFILLKSIGKAVMTRDATDEVIKTVLCHYLDHH